MVRWWYTNHQLGGSSLSNVIPLNQGDKPVSEERWQALRDFADKYAPKDEETEGE